jgi:hypothetical protein
MYSYLDVLVVECIANVHEHLLASYGVFDEGFETTVFLCCGFPCCWVGVVCLATHFLQRLKMPLATP